jgi:hypothetical protein
MLLSYDVDKVGDHAMQSEEHRSGGGEQPKSNGEFQMPKWVVLLPVSVDVASVMREPVELQLTLRSAIAKAVSVVGRLRLRPPLNRLLPGRISESSHE